MGGGVASSSMLDGIIGFKSSYAPIKTDISPVVLPNVSYLAKAPALTSDYRNLRSQCIFTLADLVNNHKIASKVTGKQKEVIIEELANYQDVSTGDGKRQATAKEDIKEIIGHSPDESDCYIMRQYFTVMERMQPQQSEATARISETLKSQFASRRANFTGNSTK